MSRNQSVDHETRGMPAADPLRVFHHDGGEIDRFLAEVDGVTAAAELASVDATRRRRWGRYRAVRPGEVATPVEITIRQVHGEFQPLIIRDPKNPRFTDEAVMARFLRQEEDAVMARIDTLLPEDEPMAWAS